MTPKTWAICCVCKALFKCVSVVSKFSFCSDKCWRHAPRNIYETIVEKQ